MKGLLPLLLLMFTSCATLFNEPTTSVHILTSEPAKTIHNEDTVYSQRTGKTNRAILEGVVRSKDDLILDVIADSIHKKVIVVAVRDNLYKQNYLTYGLGYLLEYNKPKAFTYDNPVYLDLKSPGNIITPSMQKKQKHAIKQEKIQSYHEGKLFVTLYYPYINWYNLKPYERIKTFGFLGIGVGLEYQYVPKRSIKFHYDGMTDFFIPFPAPYDYDLSEGQEHRRTFANTYALMHQHLLNRWHIGYGASITKYWATHHFILNEEHIFNNQAYYGLGLLFPIHYYTGRAFRLGVLYRPTFYRPSRGIKYTYEHVISIDFGWRIRLVK